CPPVAPSGAKTVGPAYPARTGGARNLNAVTTQKLPPPPRSAQNRSALFVSPAVTTLPSARTTSADNRLSMVRPYSRVRYPIPPPSVRPPTPVDEMKPQGTARPNGWVA